MINNSILKWTKDIVLTWETAQVVYPVAAAVNSFYSIKPKFPDFYLWLWASNSPGTF